MAENKKSFIAYSDWKETFDSLPDEYAGKLIKHIFSYVNDEDPQTECFIINSVFANIKNTLKRDLGKWEKQLEQRRDAGKKSAESRRRKKIEKESTINEDDTLSTSVQFRSTSGNEKTRNSTVSVSDSVSVSDILLEKETKDIMSEQSSDDTPLLNLDTTNQTLEIKITKSFFDLFRNNQKENGVTIFTKYDKTKLKTWLVHVKRMIEIDKISIEDLREVHVWLSDPKYRNSEFWRKNIISTQKLREQFPKLQSAMKDDLKTISNNKPKRSKSRLGL